MQNPSRMLVDNWLLELASAILWQGLSLQPIPENGYSFSMARDINAHYRVKWREVPRNDRVIALLHLLDLIVINDELIYDVEWQNTWDRYPALNEIKPLLRGIRLGKATKKKFAEIIPPNEHDMPDYRPAFVREGALYYLGLAKALGVYYWPSPYRADFLKSKIFSKSDSGYAFEFQDLLNNSLNELVQELVSPLKSLKAKFDFPGFGSSILANCEDAHSILPVALQFRNTKVCTEFRHWLQDLDNALISGNIKTIAQGMRDLRDVLHFIKKEVGDESTHLGKVEFQIGISPSVTIDTDALRMFLGKVAPKPYHITFLRSHLFRVLESPNIWTEVKRLFPDVDTIP